MNNREYRNREIINVRMDGAIEMLTLECGHEAERIGIRPVTTGELYPCKLCPFFNRGKERTA